MKHVLDLDGDWFAMPPVEVCDNLRITGECAIRSDCCQERVPAVGDVIGSTRTIEDEGNLPAVVWADPPFLRVAKVHKITPVWLALFDVPNARPGGWAVRVEPAPDYGGYLLPDEQPCFDGPPLNRTPENVEEPT